MVRDFSKIGLGEGKFYINYGEVATELEAGYVRGGEFNSNLTMRHIQVDGKKGHVKGDAVYEEELPELTFTAMQIDASLLSKLFVGMTVTDNADGTGTITRSNANPEDADYHVNVAFVGKTKDGTPIIIKVLNALGEGPIGLTFTDKGEIEIPAMFTGNYETIDDANAPFEITVPYADSVIV